MAAQMPLMRDRSRGNEIHPRDVRTPAVVAPPRARLGDLRELESGEGSI